MRPGIGSRLCRDDVALMEAKTMDVLALLESGGD